MVVIKGSKEGFTVFLNGETDPEKAREELEAKFGETKSFFKGETVRMHLSSETFSEFELFLLQKTIQDVLTETDIIFTDEPFAEPVAAEKTTNETPKAEEVIPCDEQESPTRFFYGTVRSGQRVETKGNLVVIGDANPGSELIAGGNIVVMGAARGVVHAGFCGDRGAMVAAIRLMPTQIRIADIISRSPDGESVPEESIPEMAYVQGESVYIRQYLTKKS